MQCPPWGRKAVKKESRDLSFRYQGRPIVARFVGGESCPKCGKGALVGAGKAKHSAALDALDGGARSR